MTRVMARNTTFDAKWDCFMLFWSIWAVRNASNGPIFLCCIGVRMPLHKGSWVSPSNDPATHCRPLQRPACWLLP